MTDAKLRERLRRLGMKPASTMQSPPPKEKAPAPVRARHMRAGEGAGVESLVPGRVVETQWGSFYLIEEIYSIAHRHGGTLLDDFLLRSGATAAALARDQALAGLPLESLAFIDTETTGLAGGAGSFAFLVGLGTFTPNGFALRQYFLRDPAEEAAMLGALAHDCESLGGWVTFNGKAFDLPIIETRYRMAHRRRLESLSRPHLDLLFPARRLFRGRLPSCSLGSIEAGVFDLQREEDDVPGYLIPQMYLDYLQTGDGRGMRRVMYHNAMDVLSMVTLAAHLLDVFSRPAERIHVAEDHLALAQWHEAAGRAAMAEPSYRAALRGHLRPDDQLKVHARYAAFLKRAGRRTEAVEHWEALFTSAPREIGPCIELAKYYEWEAGDFASAMGWTKVALRAAAKSPAGWEKQAALEELRHRLDRLAAKIVKRGG